MLKEKLESIHRNLQELLLSKEGMEIYLIVYLLITMTPEKKRTLEEQTQRSADNFDRACANLSKACKEVSPVLDLMEENAKTIESLVDSWTETKPFKVRRIKPLKSLGSPINFKYLKK